MLKWAIVLVFALANLVAKLYTRTAALKRGKNAGLQMQVYLFKLLIYYILFVDDSLTDS